MKIKYYSSLVLILFIAIAVFMSCSDQWNNHYEETSIESKSDLNLFDFIKSQENLTSYTKMLQATGYDTILSKAQTFTVWAPNDQSLAGIDISNADLAMKLVKNSIARFSYTTSGIDEKTILMLNSKFIKFQKASSGYTFDGGHIAEANLGTANGIVHIMDEYVPSKMNGWEFINNTPGLDSMKQYVNSLSKVVLDTASSYQNGIFVDSVFKTINPLLTHLAALNVEDSTYTGLFLDNTAWKTAVETIAPYYKMVETDGGATQQRASTLWLLARNLFYRGEIENPSALNKLTSTGFITTYEPNLVFQGAQKFDLSNGLAYMTSQFNIKDTASWNKTIKVEAEYAGYGRLLSNYTPVTYAGLGLKASISGDFFLALTDASLSTISKVYATFPIPYTLSTKYNVYCVFVPKSLLDSTNMKPYQVKFTINSLNSSGKVASSYINSNNELVSSSSAQATFITNPSKIDTMLVAKNIQLPYSNVIYNGETTAEKINNIKFSVKVESVTTKTSTTYTRDMMIDCIILEPVKE
ncbi:MAG: fasciclin domain-containing protein [Dysgonamonadaceae bacterium]